MHLHSIETAADRTVRAAAYFAGRRTARAAASKARKVAGAERKAALQDARAKATAEHAVALEAERARKEAVEQARAQQAIDMAAVLEQHRLEREAYLGLKRLGFPYQGQAFADMVQQFAILQAATPADPVLELKFDTATRDSVLVSRHGPVFVFRTRIVLTTGGISREATPAEAMAVEWLFEREGFGCRLRPV